MTDPAAPSPRPPRWLIFLVILGLYLTLRGYHSRDGDQAYRLPILLHRQDPGLFANDPFVRAFDAFNPHRGSLALLNAASRPAGLSAGLFGLFVLTFVATTGALDRLARAVWPEQASAIGVVAVALILAAKAGNVGTNHLFEAMLLDRLMAFALGWVALASAMEDPSRGWWRSALAIGLAGWIHPSVGLQLTMLLGASWWIWCFVPAGTEVRWPLAVRASVALGVAVAPGVLMNLGQGARLLEGLPADEFRLLSVELQGPQHMLPHLWRLPQWLAWGCYPVLAGLSLAGVGLSAWRSPWPRARTRLALLLAVNLLGLGAAWFAVEVLRDLRITLFQPFRMATLARGLCLVAASGRVVELWRRGGLTDRSRALLISVGLAGDWALVIATLCELTVTAIESVPLDWLRGRRWPVVAAGLVVLVLGLRFLARHDTESGHIPLLASVGVALVRTAVARRHRLSGPDEKGTGTSKTRSQSPVLSGPLKWTRRRLAFAVVLAWAVPLVALTVQIGPAGERLRSRSWARGLVERCRFTAEPTDDIERLAVWCRDHTSPSARFVGPPGPKTFRLWSLRSLAFNRAASPYHAAGLADWSARFRDHVAFQGTTDAFVQSYLADRHGLERRYQTMSDVNRAALAIREGASFVVAAAPANAATGDRSSPLEPLHIEGRYAVYRVRSATPIASADQPARR